MKMKTIARLMPLLAIGLVSGQASAAGFQLLEQNASGIGNADAGVIFGTGFAPFTGGPLNHSRAAGAPGH